MIDWSGVSDDLQERSICSPHGVGKGCRLNKSIPNWYRNVQYLTNDAPIVHCTSVIAERLSARHIIRQYDLIERIYVCMCVCQSHSGMQYSMDILYLLQQPRSIWRMRIRLHVATSIICIETLAELHHNYLMISCKLCHDYLPDYAIITS